MQVEYVARVRLAPRGLAQEQRDLPVDLGVLGQVVEHEQRVSTALGEVLGHRARSVGREPLQTWRRIPRGHDADRALLAAETVDGLDRRCDRGRTAADGGVHADDVGRPLADDGVDGESTSCQSSDRR